jgi:C1A family cysteine protease
MARKGEGEVSLEEVRAAAAKSTWTAGETFLSRMPRAEKQRRLGYVPGPNQQSLAAREAAARASLAASEALAAAAPGAPPASHDWRNVGGQNFISPIRDQGGCGSCVSFGTIATIEGTARVGVNDPGLAIDLSEAQLFYCYGAAAGRNCDNGWWPDQALDASRDSGLVDETCFPYTAGDQACNLCSGWQNQLTTITAWHTISSPNDMKDWLTTHGPLVSCYAVYDDFYYYTGGVYKHHTGDLLGGHCISVVGFDDKNKCWICKNSWGTSFGESGFFRIGYGECGIDGTMWAVDGVAGPTPTPTPSGTGVPLYRYWNADATDHFYTTDWSELGNGNYGWAYEGVQCYVWPSQAPNTVPLYRYWNPDAADHFYTTNWSELGNGAYGWNFEGVQCYVYPAPADGTLPLFRYWNGGNADHFYTTDWSELGIGNYGWVLEGIQCYVLIGPGPSASKVPATFRRSSGAAVAAMGSFMASGSFSTSSSFMTKSASQSRPSSFQVRQAQAAAAPSALAPTAGGGLRVTIEGN